MQTLLPLNLMYLHGWVLERSTSSRRVSVFVQITEWHKFPSSYKLAQSIWGANFRPSMSLADFETQIYQAPQKGPLKNISLGAWFGILRYLNAIFSFNFHEPICCTHVFCLFEITELFITLALKKYECTYLNYNDIKDPWKFIKAPRCLPFAPIPEPLKMYELQDG